MTTKACDTARSLHWNRSGTPCTITRPRPSRFSTTSGSPLERSSSTDTWLASGGIWKRNRRVDLDVARIEPIVIGQVGRGRMAFDERIEGWLLQLVVRFIDNPRDSDRR